MSQQLEDKALELLNRFDDLASQYTPEVVDAAIEVIRFNGVLSIAGGLVALVTAVVCMVFARRLATKENESAYADDAVVGAMAFKGLAFIGFVIAAIGLFYVWNWVAIFEPKLALAKQVLGL